MLGVTCTPRSAFLAVSEEGVIVEEPLGRIDVASLYEASAELVSTMEEIRRAYDELRPDRVVILKPETNRRVQYDEVAPRVALETLFRVAAVRADLAVDVLARPTVRSRLGLPRSGSLRSRVADAIKEPVGKYWSQGRDVAALAALAGARL